MGVSVGTPFFCPQTLIILAGWLNFYIFVGLGFAWIELLERIIIVLHKRNQVKKKMK